MPSETPTSGELSAVFADAGEAALPEADLKTWWTGFSDPTLDALIAEGLEKNLDVRVAAQRLIAARAQGRTTVARFAPDVSVSAQTRTSSVFDGQDLRSATGGTESSQTTYDIGPQVSWEIPLFGRLGAAIQGDRANRAAAEADARAVRVSVVADITAGYADLRSAQSRGRSLDESIQRFARIGEIAGIARRAGLTSDIDLADAERLLASAQARRPQATILEAAARDRLLILRDRAPGTSDPLATRLSLVEEVPAFDRPIPAATPADLLRLRPDVLAAEQRALLAASAVGIAKSELYPRLTLGGSISFSDNLAGNQLPGSSVVGGLVPTLSIPLWDYGQRRAAVTQREAEFQQALIGYRGAVLAAAAEAQGALTRRANGLKALEAARTAEAAARRRADAVAKLNEAGLASLRERLLAETELLEASLTRLDTEAAEAGAVIAVFRAFGGGA
jgi:NodT family efflux transporter outer membrane factor (OMF) lipoprotein